MRIKARLLMGQLALLMLVSLAFPFTTHAQKNDPESGWIYLFDGTSTDGWRGYNADVLPPGWTIKDSTLTFDTELGKEQDYKGGKDILYGAEAFENFELYLEWKLPEGGNSGIFYHVKEGYKIGRAHV